MLGLGGAAILEGLLFVHALGSYWRFYHLGTPGVWLGLAFVVLPAAVIVAFVAGWITSLRLPGYRPSGVLWRSGLVMGGVLGALLALEILRTTAARSGEGEGAGDLLPYVTYHLR